jgi:peroxiredoxin
MKTVVFALLTLLTIVPAHAEIAQSANQARPMLVGQQAPSARLLDLDGTPVQLTEVLAAKQTVLVLFRGGWCPYCNRQLQQLQVALKHLQDLGYQVVAVSPDAPQALSGFRTSAGLHYALYSDPEATLAQKLGLAYHVQARDFGGQQQFEKWIAQAPKARRANPVLPVPAVYLLTRSGVAFFQYVNIDHTVRLSGEVLLTAARVYGEK